MLDPAGQRAVVRIDGRPAQVVTKGESLPDSGYRIVAVRPDRIETDTGGQDHSLKWFVPDEEGRARLIEPQTRPAAGVTGIHPEQAVATQGAAR